MKELPGCMNIRIASRTNQRIIMLNTGINNSGFTVCRDCGAAFPGNDSDVLKGMKKPYRSRTSCRHDNTINVNLSYDFFSDMLQ